ncbi:hypothetical protein ZIOFF_016585 [Zingiber officinale]|uniref:Protein kinase domain-containing protein n=1 Tax=Zingiber officinale TaxID=94328 RepID=A0A8J5I1R7_ZINOF|nr:hypothetical protein ZIOFF_016585 [Zingiber officinale]
MLLLNFYWHHQTMKKRQSYFGFAVLLWIIFSASTGVEAQSSTEGFISIDCGTAGNHSYVDGITGIPYASDDRFTDAGINYNISDIYSSPSLANRQLLTLRSFPDGARNCYTLKPLVRGQKYLVRAAFLYGNYDGEDNASTGRPLQFDLHLGVDLWLRVNVSGPTNLTMAEALFVAAAEFAWVCLVNTGGGVPFISSLELRPLKAWLYSNVTAEQPLVLYWRLNLGGTTLVRYPDDAYDRLWEPFQAPFWGTISTTLPIVSTDGYQFEAPSVVLQTAATTADTDTPLSFYFRDDTALLEFYFALYSTEVELLPPNATRVFDVYLNSQLALGGYEPPYLQSDYMYNSDPRTGSSKYEFVLNATLNSTLPPILNALEVYYAMNLRVNATDANDVEAMMAIKAEYRVKKNWQGDPCAPKEYAWVGLNCSNSPLRVVSINMSSSGLTGSISDSFALLDTSEYLDLSYNNLTGEVPDFLGNLTSLKVLNLTGNNFTGSIPSSLLKRSEEGSLILRSVLVLYIVRLKVVLIYRKWYTPELIEVLCLLDSSTFTKLKNERNSTFSIIRFTNHTIPGNTRSKKKTNTLVIVVICCAVLGLLSILILAGWFIWLRKRGKVLVTSSVTRHTEATIAQKNEHGPHPQVDSGKFTFNHLQVITNNFAQVIGKGAFGTFYLGHLDNVTQVAVKVQSQSTSQQTREFEFEVKQALISRDSLSRTLSWRERLIIALEAAQGLDYLHRGCLPPIMHRDLKTSNILLGEKLEAKLTDYGMSKSFSNNTDVTRLEMVGTPGYIDPEFHTTYQLTEKSDIYSFGVVLLELITGQRAIQSGRSKVHIVQYMASYIAAGNIDAVVDKRFRRSFSSNSIRNVTDLAMQCTADTSADRPTIVDVVNQLKVCIELEATSENGTDRNVEGERSVQFSALEVEGSNHHLGPR